MRLLGDAPMSTTTSKAETKHTPGPWAVIDAGPTNDHKDSRICDDSGDILAVVRGRDVPDSIHIANASLIAAAPDLLAACKSVGITPAALDRMLVATPRMTAVHISLTVDQVRVIYAAIARAEGGAA